MYIFVNNIKTLRNWTFRIIDNSLIYCYYNIKGDVIAIHNANGTLVASYAYDAWGKCTILVGNDSANSIANINPFRYRSYYYDTETGLYYLETRYYDPEIGRFISADAIEYLDPETIGGLNLFAYCNNNPVMYADPEGHFAISTAIAVGFWIGLCVGLIAGATAGGIIAHNEAEKNGSEGAELVAWTITGVIGGGVIGAVIGAALGAAIGYGVGAIWGTAPVAGSNGAVALWSGGKGIAAKAASDFATQTGAKIVSQTFAGKTLSFAQHFLPKSFSYYLWGKLSAEFVSGAASATIFLYDFGIDYTSVFNQYEIWVLLEKGIERVIHFVK